MLVWYQQPQEFPIWTHTVPAASEVFYQGSFWVLKKPGPGCCRSHRMPPATQAPGPHRQQYFLPPSLNTRNNTVRASLLRIQPPRSMFVHALLKIIRLKVMPKALFCHQALPYEDGMPAMSLSLGSSVRQGLISLIPHHNSFHRFINARKARNRAVASGMEAEGADRHCWGEAAWHFWGAADQPRRHVV